MKRIGKNGQYNPTRPDTALREAFPAMVSLVDSFNQYCKNLGGSGDYSYTDAWRAAYTSLGYEDYNSMVVGLGIGDDFNEKESWLIKNASSFSGVIASYFESTHNVAILSGTNVLIDRTTSATHQAREGVYYRGNNASGASATKIVYPLTEDIESFAFQLTVTSTISKSSSASMLVAFSSGVDGVAVGGVTSSLTDEIVTIMWKDGARIGWTHASDTLVAGTYSIVIRWNSDESAYRLYVDGIRKDNAAFGTPSKFTTTQLRLHGADTVFTSSRNYIGISNVMAFVGDTMSDDDISNYTSGKLKDIISRASFFDPLESRRTDKTVDAIGGLVGVMSNVTSTEIVTSNSIKYSDFNNRGGTISDGVTYYTNNDDTGLIPIDTVINATASDATKCTAYLAGGLRAPCVNQGKARQDATIINNPCVEFDGVDDYGVINAALPVTEEVQDLVLYTQKLSSGRYLLDSREDGNDGVFALFTSVLEFYTQDNVSRVNKWTASLASFPATDLVKVLFRFSKNSLEIYYDGVIQSIIHVTANSLDDFGSTPRDIVIGARHSKDSGFSDSKLGGIEIFGESFHMTERAGTTFQNVNKTLTGNWVGVNAGTFYTESDTAPAWDQIEANTHVDNGSIIKLLENPSPEKVNILALAGETDELTYAELQTDLTPDILVTEVGVTMQDIKLKTA